MKDINRFTEHSGAQDTSGKADLHAEKSTEGGFFDEMRKSQIRPALENTLSLEADLLQSAQTSETVSLTGEEQGAVKVPENIHGDMPHEARRALVTLLRQGAILHSQKARLFELLCRYQTVIRRHLAEVYLRLSLDEKAGVAFVTSVQSDEEAGPDDSGSGDSEEESAVSLITRRTLSIYDTLLVLVLRKYYQEREITGEQVIVVDIERVASDLVPFAPLTNSDKSDRRKVEQTLNRLVEKKILRKVSGSEGRYEITPVIRYVVNAEFLESMLGEYHRIAAEKNIELNGIHEKKDDQIGEDNV